MSREATIENTMKAIEKLPDNKLKEVYNFISFMLRQYEEEQLTLGIQKLTQGSKAFEFLEKEEDLYSVNDLKEVYNG